MKARTDPEKRGPELTVGTVENPQELRRSVSEQKALPKSARA